MRLFGNRNGKERAGSDATDTLSSRLAKWYNEHEIRLARYLNFRTRGFSFRTWLVLLVGFCGLVGGYLLQLLVGIFN